MLLLPLLGVKAWNVGKWSSRELVAVGYFYPNGNVVECLWLDHDTARHLKERTVKTVNYVLDVPYTAHTTLLSISPSLAAKSLPALSSKQNCSDPISIVERDQRGFVTTCEYRDPCHVAWLIVMSVADVFESHFGIRDKLPRITQRERMM